MNFGVDNMRNSCHYACSTANYKLIIAVLIIALLYMILNNKKNNTLK